MKVLSFISLILLTNGVFFLLFILIKAITTVQVYFLMYIAIQLTKDFVIYIITDYINIIINIITKVVTFVINVPVIIIVIVVASVSAIQSLMLCIGILLRSKKCIFRICVTDHGVAVLYLFSTLNTGLLNLFISRVRLHN